MFVPRLGYPSEGAKVIYLQITRPEDVKAEKKEEKEKKKNDKKVAAHPKKPKRTKESAQDTSKETPKVSPATSAATENNATTANTETTTTTKPEPVLDRRAQREAEHEKSQAEKAQRLRDRIQAFQDKQDNAPVSGSFLLYNLSQERILFHEHEKIEETDPGAPYPLAIDFHETLPDGLYNVIVEGSGHRSETPILVSDTLYWDALQLVLQDIGKAHCPSETGKYEIIQECSLLTVQPSGANTAVQKPQTIEGGWYTANDQGQNILKWTPEVSSILEMLIHLYDLNPKAFKYVTLPGIAYAESTYPDLLDEANWGIRYLVTIQQPDGGFPDGIKKSDTDGDNDVLLPESGHATALAIAALANTAKAFKKQDLSLTVQLVRAAEKGWSYLVAHPESVDPESMLLASSAMRQISSDSRYATAFETSRKQVKSISAETALLLGQEAQGIALTKEDAATEKSISGILPMIVGIQRHQEEAYDNLAERVTQVFGYEKVPFVRDMHFYVSSALTDPLQWMATKTGHVATRLGQGFDQEWPQRATKKSNKTQSDRLKNLEKQEQDAKQRLTNGYNELSLTSLERVYLAYGLALLNQHVELVHPKSKKSLDQYADPDRTIKGYFPKDI